MERTLRTIADILRASLVLGAIHYIGFTEWNKPMGYAMAMMAFAAVAARFMKAPAGFDLMFVALLALDGWVTAWGILGDLNKNDRPGHVLLSLTVTPLLFYGAVRIKAVNSKPENFGQTLAVGLVAMMMTVALGALWEIAEWQADKHLGTTMSLGYSDTLGDMVCDVIGGFAGGIVVVMTLNWQRARAKNLAAVGLSERHSEEASAPALAFDAIHE
jgi:uncharacterized membrane protein YjdF